MYLQDRNSNPTPQTVTTAPKYSLASLIVWLETMPPDEKYEFINCAGRCLLSQYATAHGDNSSYYETARAFFKGTGPGYDFESSSSKATVIAIRQPYTFGAALLRAREIAGGTV